MKKFDVTKHILIAKHTKLGDREKADLLKRYSITIDNLPRILKEDAAISGLSAKPGDVIMIARPSATAGESLFYRVVINA